MKLLQPVDPRFWWRVAEACDHATFFHTPLWHRLISSSYPGCRDVSRGAVLPDGTGAVLPLLEDRTRRGWLPVRHSTYAGCYGGVIADGPIGPEVIARLLRDATRWPLHKLRLVGNPLGPPQPPPGGFVKVRDDCTHVLELASDYGSVFSRFTRGHRSAILRGRQRGVGVRVAGRLEDYRSYYAAYEDALRRWGTRASSRYPWALFESAFRLAREQPREIKLWVAEVEGRIVGGALVFYWRRHAAWWHGAVGTEALDRNPGFVLQDAIIRDACERGYRHYDFNPSGGHQGADRFKRHHGALEWTVARYEYRGPITRWALRLGLA